MPLEHVNSLRPKFRAFKRYASLLRDGREALGDSATLSLRMSWDEERGAQSSFEEKAPIIRLAALLRPFMSDESPIELRSFWSELRNVPELLDDATIKRMESNFATADGLLFPLIINNREMTARDIYFAYAEGEFFNDNPQARELLKSMSFMAPAADLLRYLFFNACATYAKLTLILIDVVLEIEKKFPASEPPVAQRRCIYCLQTEGDFGPEEHVIPEAFGIDAMILAGAVCQGCNNSLSRLDQYLANDFDLLALLRVIYVPLTKKGKFPHADLREFKLEKIKPRHLRITNKTKKDVLIMEEHPDGTLRGSMNFLSRRPVDMLRVARALFKIGLGMVAFDEGVSVACSDRFDAARAFVRGEGNIPNHLLVLRNGKPTGSVSAAWQSFGGATGVELDFYGVRFVINLEASPFGIRSGPIADQLQSFWLGDETKGGVVPPCGADCVHGIRAVQRSRG
jgi:hypothetical protein